MNKTKIITLCADDFGLNSGVSQGILQLASKGRLSAVSCMVNSPDFTAYAPELSLLKSQLQIGLHFNLTEGVLITAKRAPYSLRELLIKAHLGMVPSRVIAQEFESQLQHFERVMGKLPDFIDGHQHIHHFPRIRKMVLAIYQQRLKHHGIAVRATYPIIDSGKFRCKTQILRWTGGKALQNALYEASIPHNEFFAGVYNFAADTNYRRLFRRWLSTIKNKTLIMCHPGMACGAIDEIAASRLLEFHYFLSDDFLHDCKEYGVSLLRIGT